MKMIYDGMVVQHADGFIGTVVNVNYKYDTVMMRGYSNGHERIRITVIESVYPLEVKKYGLE